MRQTTAKRGRPARGQPSGRDRLLAAAKAEFGTRGYGATTIDHLIATAQVNAPTLYHHFGGKRGLFVAAAISAYDQVLTTFRTAVAAETSRDFVTAVDTIFDVSIEIIGSDLTLPRMFLVIQFELPRQPGLAEELQPALREFRRFFDDIAALAPPELADDDYERRNLSRALIAIIDGLNGQALLLPRTDEYPALVSTMRTLIRRPALSREPM